MNTTLPYSPSPLAKDIVNPARSTGAISGKITRNTVRLSIGSEHVCRLLILEIDLLTGCTDRTTNGIPMKISATVIPSFV